MLTHLKLTRPLCFLDCEATSPDPATARLIEIAILRLEPGADSSSYLQRFQPGCPVGDSAAVHGITDSMLAGMPAFGRCVDIVTGYLDGADLAGYGITHYDLRLLCAEYRRSGREFPLAGRRVVDAMRIYHKREPRDLSAAVRRYTGKDHIEAHMAAGDVRASVEVLEGQLAEYQDLPREAGALAESLRGPDAVDLEGKLVRRDGQIQLNFGRHKGTTLLALAASKPDYLHWALRENVLLPDAAEIVRQALGLSPVHST